jgi:hypothetical protein
MADVKRMRSSGLVGAAVAQPDPAHRDQADAGLHKAVGPLAVPNHAIAPIGQVHAPSV